MRRLGIIVLLLLSCGCRVTLVRNGTQPSATPTTSPRRVGTALGTAPPTSNPAGLKTTPGPSARASAPAFVLRATDAHGNHPQGIPVRISGPVNAVVRTDAHGEIPLTRGGVYHFAVVSGCTEAVQVFSGGSATAGVTPGRTTHGDIGVDWRHRMTPAPPVFSDPAGAWPRNQDTTVQFNVLDRCTSDFAPNAAYPTFRFETSKNLRVSKTPADRSNAKSQGFVTVRCSAPGPVKLIAFDETNPTDTFDIGRESSDYSGPPSCGS